MSRNNTHRTERFPPGSPATWIADGHVTCNVQCRSCNKTVDVKLDTLPQDLDWPTIGRRMTCSSCGAPAGNIVPNWHDRKASFWKQR